MKLPKLAFALFTTLCILTSCAKNAALSSRDAAILGSWTWSQTDGGIANNIHDTPGTTGKTIQWTFSNNLSYAIYENGILQTKGNYHITNEKSIYDGDEKPVINFDSGMRRIILKVDGTTLEVGDNAYDGTTSLFTRGSTK